MASTLRLIRMVVVGHLSATLPAALLLAGLPLAAGAATLSLGWGWKAPAVAAALVCGYFAARQWWGWAVTRWRIRSYGSLDELEWFRLEKVATTLLLFWPGGHPVEELEVQPGDRQRRVREVMERNADLRELEKAYFTFDAPRRYGFGLKKRKLLLSLGGRLAVAAVAGASLYAMPQPYLGLMLLAVICYPTRDFGMYRYLPFRGEAFELSAAGVLLRIPDLTMHYWHHHTSYRLYRHEAVLVLEGPGGSQETIDLSYYDIRDYRRLASIIDVYIEQYSSKVAVANFN